MPRVSEAAKDAAFNNQNRASAVVIAAGPAGAAAALIPVAGPFVAAGIGLVAAGFGWRALGQGKIVRDPPRDDYDVLTSLPPPVIDTTVRGDTALELAAADLARATDETMRAFEAMTVALERASGAELAGDSDMEAHRTQEVFKFAQLASGGLMASSELVGPFRGALEGSHADILGALEAAGLPRDHFRFSETLMSDDPVDELSSRLGQAAESDYEFSQFLRSAVAERSLLQPGSS